MVSGSIKDLVIVAGHAAFKKEVEKVPEHPEQDESWVLQTFQIGEPPFYIEHIRRGVILAVNNPVALLVFSGGRTREQAGHWSEAKTYHKIAEHYGWWIAENIELRENVSERATAEEYARDSFENLLFSICRFQQYTGHYPRNVTIVSWAFKRARLELHRAAIRFPVGRFHFDGFNDPVDLTEAWVGETKALHSIIESRYGAGGNLGKKRQKRNPYDQQHPYATCQGLQTFFNFIDNPRNGQEDFPEQLPWED